MFFTIVVFVSLLEMKSAPTQGPSSPFSKFSKLIGIIFNMLVISDIVTLLITPDNLRTLNHDESDLVVGRHCFPWLSSFCLFWKWKALLPKDRAAQFSKLYSSTLLLSKSWIKYKFCNLCVSYMAILAQQLFDFSPLVTWHGSFKHEEELDDFADTEKLSMMIVTVNSEYFCNQ